MGERFVKKEKRKKITNVTKKSQKNMSRDLIKEIIKSIRAG